MITIASKGNSSLEVVQMLSERIDVNDAKQGTPVCRIPLCDFCDVG